MVQCRRRLSGWQISLIACFLSAMAIVHMLIRKHNQTLGSCNSRCPCSTRRYWRAKLKQAGHMYWTYSLRTNQVSQLPRVSTLLNSLENAPSLHMQTSRVGMVQVTLAATSITVHQRCSHLHDFSVTAVEEMKGRNFNSQARCRLLAPSSELATAGRPQTTQWRPWGQLLPSSASSRLG